VAPDCMKIDICRRDLVEVLAAPSIDLATKDRRPTDPSDDVVTLTAPVKLKRASREMKMLVDDPGDRASIDMSLLRIVARARDIQARLTQNTSLTVHDIAREEQVTAAYVYTLLRLPWLAPDITTAIVNGWQPPQLNAKKLMRLTAHLPADWAEQRALLGFR
jgi:site-specific DNA recombinase